MLGFLRPKIYIPFGLSENEREYILAHEECHLKRFDHLIKPLSFLVLAAQCLTRGVVILRPYEPGHGDELRRHVLSTRGSGIAADYSTSLLSFAANRRLPAAGPLCFGESGAKGRIKNALRWKRPGIWITAAAVALCAIAIAACALNPRQNGAAVVAGMPEGSYIFKSQVYMNPLSSFIAFEGYEQYYTFTGQELVITGTQGEQERCAIAPVETEFDEQAFKIGFYHGFGSVDISAIKAAVSTT